MVAVVEAANAYAAFVSSTVINSLHPSFGVHDSKVAPRRSYYHPDFAKEETDT